MKAAPNQKNSERTRLASKSQAQLSAAAAGKTPTQHAMTSEASDSLRKLADDRRRHFAMFR